MRRGFRNGSIALGAATGYLACVVIGTLLEVPPSSFSTIWPGAAFLISVLLLLPERKWWLCLAAVIPTHFVMAAFLYPAESLVIVTTEVLGNLSLAIATTIIVRRTIASPLFDTFASVLKFILIAGVAVPAVVNALILSVHLASGRIDAFWTSWLQWMIAGFFPTVTIPPLLVLLVRGGFMGQPVAPTRVRIEMAVLVPALFALSFLAFGEIAYTAHWPALYLAPLPLLLWAAVRTGAGGTSLSLLTFAAGVVAQALRHHGPFSAQSPIEDVVSLQIFLVTTSAPLMLLAALVDERRRAADLFQRSEARIQLAASSTSTGLWQWDLSAPHLWLTDNCRAMFDLPDEATYTPLAFLDAIHPGDQASVGEAIEAALADGAPQPAVEFRLCPAGATRWFILEMRTDLGDDGKPVRVSGVFRDITERAEARLEIERLGERLESLQDDERRRIAQELHDSTAQHLVAARLNMAMLRTQIPASLLALSDDIVLSLAEATTEIRTFTYLLHPPQLDERGLKSVLERYVPGFERRTGIAMALRVSATVDELPGAQQVALLRITQESLGNIQRHAQATRASVDLRCIAGVIHLVVRDDGKGIEADAGKQLRERLGLGVGIPAMTARVKQLGGRIDVNGRGKGTTIHVAIPMHRSIGLDAQAFASAPGTLGRA